MVTRQNQCAVCNDSHKIFTVLPYIPTQNSLPNSIAVMCFVWKLKKYGMLLLRQPSILSLGKLLSLEIPMSSHWSGFRRILIYYLFKFGSSPLIGQFFQRITTFIANYFKNCSSLTRLLNITDYPLVASRFILHGNILFSQRPHYRLGITEI